MAKIIFSKEELVLQLKQQLSSIEDFCKIYDEGKHYICQEMAVKLRVIFHNTNNSKALIHQLKLTQLPILCSSTSYDPNNLATHLGLISMEHRVNLGWQYIPNLSVKNLKSVSQENWWNSKKIIVDSEKNSFTRSKIILAMANKDGGAHVDDSLDLDIYNLTRSTTSGWAMVSESGSDVPMNPVPPSIRQMSFEVLETFKTVDIRKESKLR